MMRRFLLIPLIVFLALALVFLISLEQETESSPSDPVLGRSLPAFTLPGLAEAAPFDSTRLPSSPFLINMFASWCLPCQAELPLLMELSKRGVIIEGIAWKDKPADVEQWLRKHGNPYRHVALDAKGSAAIELGMRGVPESYLIGPDGRILWHYPGPLDESTFKDSLLPLLEKGSAR